MDTFYDDSLQKVSLVMTFIILGWQLDIAIGKFSYNDSQMMNLFFLLLYVNNMPIVGKNTSRVQKLKQELNKYFAM